MHIEPISKVVPQKNDIVLIACKVCILYRQPTTNNQSLLIEKMGIDMEKI